MPLSLLAPTVCVHQFMISPLSGTAVYDLGIKSVSAFQIEQYYCTSSAVEHPLEAQSAQGLYYYSQPNRSSTSSMTSSTSISSSFPTFPSSTARASPLSGGDEPHRNRDHQIVPPPCPRYEKFIPPEEKDESECSQYFTVAYELWGGCCQYGLALDNGIDRRERDVILQEIGIMTPVTFSIFGKVYHDNTEALAFLMEILRKHWKLVSQCDVQFGEDPKCERKVGHLKLQAVIDKQKSIKMSIEEGLSFVSSFLERLHEEPMATGSNLPVTECKVNLTSKDLQCSHHGHQGRHMLSEDMNKLMNIFEKHMKIVKKPNHIVNRPILGIYLKSESLVFECSSKSELNPQFSLNLSWLGASQGWRNTIITMACKALHTHPGTAVSTIFVLSLDVEPSLFKDIPFLTSSSSEFVALLDKASLVDEIRVPPDVLPVLEKIHDTISRNRKEKEKEGKLFPRLRTLCPKLNWPSGDDASLLTQSDKLDKATAAESHITKFIDHRKTVGAAIRFIDLKRWPCEISSTTSSEWGKNGIKVKYPVADA
ncbi:hypothetical protein CPC08DRAFT_725110 [Agrocybe pediades]|nr:hypothetical protein CPC08DRAFT_725110 [Agrocybe pediades]